MIIIVYIQWLECNKSSTWLYLYRIAKARKKHYVNLNKCCGHFSHKIDFGRRRERERESCDGEMRLAVLSYEIHLIVDCKRFSFRSFGKCFGMCARFVNIRLSFNFRSHFVEFKKPAVA